MFETSVIHAQTQAARGRLSLLTVSVIAHSAVVVGVLAMSIASVDFPTYSPDEYSRAPVFMPVQIPPPLGNPNGGAVQKPQTPVVKPAPQPTQPTAPTLIPETITPAPASGTSESSTVDSGPGTGTVPGPIGVLDGVKDSVGALDALPIPHDVPVAQPENRIYQQHEVDPAVSITKVPPRYPPAFARAAVPMTVVVRCVIDRQGNLHDPEFLNDTPAPFQAEVLRVLGQWKYKPATYGDRPVDSYLNLTVTFSVRR